MQGIGVHTSKHQRSEGKKFAAAVCCSMLLPRLTKMGEEIKNRCMTPAVSGTPKVGPQKWDPKRGTPKVGPQKWDPKSGTPKVGPQKWDPRV